MMFNIWKLSEHRNRLNKKNSEEFKWLKEIEKEYGIDIQDHLDKVEITDEFRNNIEGILKENFILSNKEIVDTLTDYLVQANDE